MLNKVMLIGYLGQDPELRHIHTGAVYCNFSLATSESYKDGEGVWQRTVEWHEITVWGALAERIGKHMRKGDKVYVEGKLKTNKYTSKAGVEIRKVIVNAAVVMAVESRKQEEPQSNKSTPSIPLGEPDDSLPF